MCYSSMLFHFNNQCLFSEIVCGPQPLMMPDWLKLGPIFCPPNFPLQFQCSYSIHFRLILSPRQTECQEESKQRWRNPRRGLQAPRASLTSLPLSGKTRFNIHEPWKAIYKSTFQLFIPQPCTKRKQGYKVLVLHLATQHQLLKDVLCPFGLVLIRFLILLFKYFPVETTRSWPRIRGLA